MRVIPYARQQVSDADVRAVEEVLRSDWLTQGPVPPRFEKAVADYCAVPYGVAVNSATSALHLACRVLGVGPGDRVWTSPNSFVASANCALYCGADVDFVDVAPDSGNLCPEALARKLAAAQRYGALPKVVIPVHFAGRPCAMAAIAELAGRYGFRIVEDASHALGARYPDGRVGDCRYADLTVFSFHPVKLITTGEGGLVTCRDPALADALQRLRSHGITRDPGRLTRSAHGPWYYEQIELGYNYRMTDIQAALGLSQLRRLDEFIARRRVLARRYRDLLANLPLDLPAQDPGEYSAWHLYVVRLADHDIRARVFEALRRQGIGANVHYIPIHTQPYYRELGFDWGDFPAAEDHYRRALTLPLYPQLAEADQDRVAGALREALA